jgi:hypothetical protein
MKKTLSKRRGSEMKAEYDFSTGVRGAATNLRLLDQELVAAFPNSKSVNDALRVLVEIAERAGTRRSS